MPYAALLLKPGINVDQTPLLNSAGFSYSSGVRFFQQMVQKSGGWTALNPASPLTGIPRGLQIWADLRGTPYIAAGSAQALNVFIGGLVYDITPLRSTDNVTVDFSTTMGSAAVTITDPSNGAITDDRVVIAVPVSVGGIVLYGAYTINPVVDTNSYTITAASPATSTVMNGGAVPAFTTTMGGTDVSVALNNHGLMAGELWTVDVSTAVGGFTLLGPYSVASVTDANTFVIQPGGTASSAETLSENGGNVRLEYLVHTGAVSTYTTTGGGYGSGDYGSGPYGQVNPAVTTVICRNWFLDNFGQDLIGNYNNSPIYVWDPTTGPLQRALAIDTTNFPSAQEPPLLVGSCFVSAPQQMIVALGANPVGESDFDPNTVRWCDGGDFTNWLASSTNLAGSYRIPSGSRIVGGVSAPNFNVLWTDVDMWLMSYLGGQGGLIGQLVWGFTKITDGVDLIAPHAAGVLGSRVFWPSYDGFYAFNGQSVVPVPCPVWDKFWYNLNTQQIYKVNVQCNSTFDEISWGFPSASGNGEVDQRITLAIDNGSPTWTYDENSIWARTSWHNNNVYGQPIATDVNGYLLQHEVSNDANGSALPSSVRTGWFSAAEGTIFSVMERLEGDLIVTGTTTTIQITIYTQDYENGPVRTYGPYDWQPGSGPPYSIVRARGRFFSIEISSNGLGTFWRLGRLRYKLRTAGTR